MDISFIQDEDVLRRMVSYKNYKSMDGKLVPMRRTDLAFIVTIRKINL